MYNALEKLRSGEALTAKEKVMHEQGLVSVLKQIHDDLDAAVFDAFGWPSTLTDEEILERLVALNAERAEEEKRGLIRWLRHGTAMTQAKESAMDTNDNIRSELPEDVIVLGVASEETKGTDIFGNEGLGYVAGVGISE